MFMVTLQWPAYILIAVLHKTALESVEWLADTV
jgi:hypothetical protein